MLIALLCGARLYAVTSSTPLSEYASWTFTVRDGMPQTAIRSVSQTRDGYVWALTDQAVLRWDGMRWVSLDYRDLGGEVPAWYASATETADGSVWIGTSAAGLIRLDHGTIRTVHERDGLADNDTVSIAEAPDGAIWTGSRLGISRIAGLRITKYVTGIVERVAAVAVTPDGIAWGASRRSLLRVENGTLSRITTADGLVDNFVNTLAVARDGSLWVGTNAGLNRIAGGKVVEAWRGQDHGIGTSINKVYIDRNGDLWVGTSGSGLLRMRGASLTSFERMTTAEGLLDDVVRSFAEDTSGALWIATPSGLQVFSDREVMPLKTADGVFNERTMCILRDAAGVVWIATRDHGVFRYAGGRLEKVNLGTAVRDDAAGTFAQLRNGSLLIGTMVGVLRTDGRGVAMLEGGRDRVANAMLEARNGEIWLATTRGLYRLRGAQQSVYLRELPSPVTTALLEDRRGRIWIGTARGVAWFENGRIVTPPPSAAIVPSRVSAFYEDAEGTVWFTLFGRGLTRYRNGKFVTYGLDEGFPNSMLYDIFEDDRGHLWIGSNNGILRVSKEALNDVAERRSGILAVATFGLFEGMVSPECNGGVQPSAWKMPDGSMWFSTFRGIAIIDPRRVRPMPRPQVLIERVLVNRRPVNVSSLEKLSPGENEIEIQYTAPAPSHADMIRFRYRLDGSDEQWIEAGPRRSVVLSHLPPGRYGFRVAAYTTNPLSASEAIIRFAIEPRFYQSWWFRVLLALAVLGIMFAIQAVRVRLITATARAQRAEAEQFIQQSHKLEALGGLASGIAHDFNNTLMAALPWAEVIARRHAKDDATVAAAKHVKTAIQRAGQLTRRLLEFAQPRKPNMHLVDLPTFMREQLKLLRASIPPGIQLRFDPPAGRWQVLADESQLSQVVVNLALNARDAMPGGGELHVALRTPTPAEAKAWSLDRQQAIVLLVSDTGAGMTTETMLRAFDPFFSTKGANGTGLGLAVTHRIIDEHRGRISVRSEPGRGTMFTIVLPRYVSHQKEDSVNADEPIAVLRGEEVLMIDDEDAVAAGIGALIELAGATFRRAARGREALEFLLSGSRPSIVILDIGLPDMSGKQVHAEIRKMAPHLPIIVSSGYGDEEIIDHVTDADTRYLQKPYEFDLLLREMQALLAKKRSEAQ